MIHGQTFEASEDAARMVEPVYRCENCGRTFTESTVGRMDDESLPCPCGVQVGDLSLWMEIDHPELRYRDETTTTWPQVVDLIVKSGFWLCEQCGFTAPQEDWDSESFGDECFITCPECQQVEDYTVLEQK